MFDFIQVLLVETVATAHAIFSKQMLWPARWNDVAIAGGDKIVLRVVLLAVAVSFLLLSCFSGPLLDVYKQTSVMFLITLTALIL